VVKPPLLSVQSVVQWVVHGARNAPLSQDVLTELCEQLTAAGLPLWSVTVFVRTLHPEIVGRRFVSTSPSMGLVWHGPAPKSLI
jgi:adenylate cyclase